MNDISADSPTTVYSPVPTGSGALVLHRELEAGLEDYRCATFDPRWALLPPSLAVFKDGRSPLIHTLLELSAYLASEQQTTISTLHNYYLDDFYLQRVDSKRSLYYRTLLRHQCLRGLERSDTVVAVSDATYRLIRDDLRLEGRTLAKLKVIRNGVDCGMFTPPDTRSGRDTCNILFAGNPTSRKGWHYLEAIASELPAHCRILCTGGLRKLDIAGAGDRIQFLPSRPHEQMAEVYGAADIFVLPSIREGLSLAMLEAMACGLPVVAFDISSAPEAIDNYKGGILCAPEDARDLLRALTELSENPRMRQEFGALNRERANSEFNLNRMVAEYKELFEDGAHTG